MLKQETPRRTFESDTDPFILLAIQDARAAQARALEEAIIDEEDISTQAEEALVMG